MTYNDFKAKWLGTPINYDNTYGAQCMDVYRMYCKEVLGVPQSPTVTGAKTVWDTYLTDYFIKEANTPNGVPVQGDIAVWNIGTFGHIAIVDSADKQYLTSFEQNWAEAGTAKDGQGVTELRRHTYANVLGWLKFKAPISPIHKGYDLTNQDSMRVAVDCLVDLQNGQLVRKVDVDEIINDSNQKLVDAATTYEKEKAVKDEQIKALEESLQKLQDTEHEWSDVADRVQRRFKAVLEEFGKVGVPLSTEMEQTVLASIVQEHLATYTKLQSDKELLSVNLLSIQETVARQEKIIIGMNKKDGAFRTINVGNIMIKFYKR